MSIIQELINLGRIYLAIPYSHKDEEVKELRYEIANCISAYLMRMGAIVFSPITHSHPLVKYGLPTDYEYWKTQDESFMDTCASIIVITLDGYEESNGVNSEIMYMTNSDKPVHYLNLNDLTKQDKELALMVFNHINLV